MNSFPREINAWKNDVARRLVGLRGAVNDIFLGMPQIPDPEIGMPFSGPLSPVPFVWHPQPNTGGTMGTPSTAANHCSLCTTALRFYEITVAGITNRNCTLCNNLNGTFLLEATDGIGSGSAVGGNFLCSWRSSAIAWCPVLGLPRRAWWVLKIVDTYPTTAPDTTMLVYWTVDEGLGSIGGAPNYYLRGCPPAAGSGSGTIVLPKETGTFLNDCQNYPASITLRGIS